MSDPAAITGKLSPQSVALARCIGKAAEEHFGSKPLDVLTMVEAMMELTGQLLANRRDAVDMAVYQMARRAGYIAKLTLTKTQ